MNQKFWGKGYGTEASKAWPDYGFKEMKIEMMNAYTHSKNQASNNILKKIGMNCLETYLDKENVPWCWWHTENPN